MGTPTRKSKALRLPARGNKHANSQIQIPFIFATRNRIECHFIGHLHSGCAQIFSGPDHASEQGEWSGAMHGPVGIAEPQPRTEVTTPMSRRISFAQQVADRLRDLIVKGGLAPGARIIERTICEQLAVSRTPLREALKLLQAEGLVEISQNKGARIMSFTPREANDLFEVIAGLESMAAELAVVRLSAGEFADLEAMHELMCGHYEKREKDTYFALNSAIHETIVKASANPVLIATHGNLMLRARRGRYMAIVDPSRWEESVGEHTEVMEAFRNKDREHARVVWKRHLLRTGETVCQVLTRPTVGVAADAAASGKS